MTFETRLDEAFGIQPAMKKTLFERKLEELDWRKAIGAAGMGLAALGGAGDAGAAPAPVGQAQELGTPVKPKSADDKAEELVKPIRDVYDKEVKVAQEKYNKILAVELDRAMKAGSLDDVKAIKKEMEDFEADDSKWKSPVHKLAIKRYAGEKEAAQKKWDAGISKIVRELVQKKELELAEKVKTLGNIEVTADLCKALIDKTFLWYGRFKVKLLEDGVVKTSGGETWHWSIEGQNLVILYEGGAKPVNPRFVFKRNKDGLWENETAGILREIK